LIENSGNIGVVKAQNFTFADTPNELILESGKKFGPINLNFETYGELNDQKSNAVLVLHALSGDAHAAGMHENEKTFGWWNPIIGPGKSIDTNNYFVICSNVIGGCKGSTGPISINPKNGKPYALDFPIITISDMVNAQHYLIEYLGIEKLLSVIGGSMGGMQVLQWMVSYPEKICSAIPIATTMSHSPQQIAFNEVGRQSIMSDPNWKNGMYYDSSPPTKGLAIARMIGHITYMSDVSMTKKFGRRVSINKEKFRFNPDFEIEGYLSYKGNNFVNRFDANSYLYITKAIDYFNILNGKNINEVFSGLTVKILVISFKSDWLYPSYQSQEIVKACKLAGLDTTYCEINSTYGHDSFLLETEEEGHLIKNFLRNVNKF
jgi:homoserine O-acetyltransferase